MPKGSRDTRPLPDWAHVNQKFKRKGATLMLLWEEQKVVYPEGLQYSRFYDRYRAWVGKLNLVMCQKHQAGEKLFIDYAGQTVPVVDPRTGSARDAQMFVACMDASQYTYAEVDS